MTPEREAYARQWSEYIRDRGAMRDAFYIAVGKPALWLAEQVGKRVSFDNDYPDEDYDDAPL